MKCLSKRKQKVRKHTAFLFKNKSHLLQMVWIIPLLNNHSRMSYSSAFYLHFIYFYMTHFTYIALYPPIIFIYFLFFKANEKWLKYHGTFPILEPKAYFYIFVYSFKKFSVKTAGFYIIVVKWKLLNQEYFLQFDCI